jgi:FkbM family methyltransferase
MKRILRKIEKSLKSLRDPIFRKALRFGVSPSHENEAMLKSLGPIVTVVDVGANVGQFALLALRYLPQAEVHSFEPLPEPSERFERVMQGQPRVHLHRCALGAAEAKTEMHVSARTDSSSLLVPALQSKIYPGTQEVGVQEVRVTRLDSCLTAADIRSPALLKIDVQGYEQPVLEGCETLLPLFDWVFAELSFVELYANQALAPEVIAWLAAKEFGLYGVYISDMSYQNGRMIQGDFLFRRIERVKV